ncbi:hypothetical protein D3C71_1367190 [compost metagenome]
MRYTGFKLLAQAQKSRPLRGMNHADGAESEYASVHDDEGSHLQRLVDSGLQPLSLPARRSREGKRSQLLLARKLGAQTALLVMLHDDIYAVADLRVKLLQLGKLADRQQKLASKSHLQEAAEPGVNVCHLQQRHFTKC